VVVEDPVADEERQRAAGETEDHGQAAGRPEGLLRQLERDGADQDAGPEGHHQADHPRRRSPHQAEHRADQQGEPADEAPERRLQHGGGIARHRALKQRAMVAVRHTTEERPGTGVR
jgi:hypothetical protein